MFWRLLGSGVLSQFWRLEPVCLVDNGELGTDQTLGRNCSK
jgi:hypothetical protein